MIILFFLDFPYAQVNPNWFIPVVANIKGEGASYWRSDIYITNIEDENLLLKFWLWIYGEDNPYYKEVNILAREYKVLEDVVFSIFGLENTCGVLFIDPLRKDGKRGKVILNSRTYTSNKDNKGTYGQNVIPVFPVSKEYLHYLNGIVNNSEFRTNLGIYCFFGGASFLVEYYDEKGELLDEEYVSLYSSGVVQKRANVEGDRIYAIIKYLNGDGLCGSYISKVDNITNDAVFFPAYFIKEE